MMRSKILIKKLMLMKLILKMRPKMNSKNSTVEMKMTGSISMMKILTGKKILRENSMMRLLI